MVQSEMNRLNIPIMGLAEARWTGSGSCTRNNMILYYSGTDNKNHISGVGIMINKCFQRNVITFIPYNDRMMLLKLRAHPLNINLVQVYAPTSDSNDADIEKFYADLEELLKNNKRHEVTIIMGDFNAKIGRGKVDNIVGKFGLGVRNERGDRLLQFCQENEMIITNTFYDLPPRRLYTWTSPRHNENRTIRNQIDFITVNKRFRNAIKSVKTYPSADGGTDHNLLVANINIKLKSLKRQERTSKININKLKNHKEQLNNEIRERLNNVSQTEDVEVTWQSLKDVLLESGNSVLGRETRVSKKDWMSPEIIQLINEKRRYKNKNKQKYKELKNKIKYEITKAKEEWMEKNCKELEELNSKHDTTNLHRKLKVMTGNTKPRTPCITRNNQGQIETEEEQIKEVWERYIKDLFNDIREDGQEIPGDDQCLEILQSEVQQAIHIAKNGKTSGPDGIPVELLKALDTDIVGKFTKLLNQIYRQSQIPSDWLKSTFIPLPKKNNPKTCNDFRLISLMNHSLKILLKIIQNRIYKKCEEQLDETQFGFRGGMGTREALFALTVLFQKCREYNKTVYACFIDFQKAFDRVQHMQLIEELGNINLDKKDITLIKNLYWNQTATVKINNTETNDIPIVRGVRQGCVLSPTLFNVYSQVIFRRALWERKEGVRIGGEVVNTIRYADDTVILAESLEDLQTLVDSVNNECQRMGININTDKTKLMIITKTPTNNDRLTINDHVMERVERFRYLGSLITSDLDQDQEIRIRIEMGRAAFLKFRSAFCNRNLHLPLRLRFLECYVWSQLLYGVETWTLKAQIIRKLEAFELWMYRRMLKVPWTARITNEEILRRVGRERKLLKTIKIRKTSYLGHVLRHNKYSILQVIMQGRVDGRKGIGRKRKSWLRNIREWTGMGVEELFYAAKDRDAFKTVVANLR